MSEQEHNYTFSGFPGAYWENRDRKVWGDEDLPCFCDEFDFDGSCVCPPKETT